MPGHPRSPFTVEFRIANVYSLIRIVGLAGCPGLLAGFAVPDQYLTHQKNRLGRRRSSEKHSSYVIIRVCTQ